jgi:hypothetical protein
LDKQKSIHIKLTEEVAFGTRRVDKLTKSLQSAEKEIQTHKIERQRTEQEIAIVQSKIDTIQSSPESQKELQMGDEQVKQYTKL